MALVTIAAYKVSLRVQSERSGGVPPVRARTGQFAGVAPLRSALHSNRTFITRGLYFIDRCGGVLFPVALTPGAGYKAALRVQSERIGGVPPLSIRAGRSTSFRSALEPNIHYSRSILKATPHKERLTA